MARPPWFNNQIKTLIEKKNNLFINCLANGRLILDRVKLQKAGAELINIIKSSKEKFYINLAKILNDSSSSNFREKVNVFNNFWFDNANL